MVIRLRLTSPRQAAAPASRRRSASPPRTAKNYTNTTSIETKAGAGAGGVTAALWPVRNSSAGKVSVNTAGGSFLRFAAEHAD